jgi:hypothetical protein
MITGGTIKDHFRRMAKQIDGRGTTRDKRDAAACVWPQLIHKLFHGA